MYRNLYFLIAGCAALVAIFLMAFNGSEGEQADYVWTNGTEPETLDIAHLTGQPEGDICFAIFEGLTVYHPQTLQPMPGVAQSWDVDGLTYTFHLRPDAWWVKQGKRFEDEGKQRNVTAHDFVYSWQRHCLPETGSQYGFLLDYVEGIDEFKRKVEEQWNEICERRKADDLPLPTKLSDLDEETRKSVQAFRDKLWADVVGIKAKDDGRTLVVRLKAFVPYFLQLTNFYPLMPVPREAIEEHGSKWILPENIVTNGAYMLEDWRFNYKIRLRKNPHYWETKKFVDQRVGELKSLTERNEAQAAELELLTTLGSFEERGIETMDALAVEKEDTSLNLYLDGQNDKVRSLPTVVVGDLLQEDQKRPIPALHHARNPTIYYFDVNLDQPVFRHGEAGRKLRVALALAIDRKRLIDEILRAGQAPAYAMVAREFARGYQAADRFGTGDFNKDLQLAKQLLQEVKDAGLKPPEFHILYNTLESHKIIAAFIQDQWKQHLGIDATLENQEWQVYLNNRRDGKFDIARAGWIPDYSDPNTFLELYTTNDVSSDRDPARLKEPVVYNPQNHGKYNNPHYNRILTMYSIDLLDFLKTAESRQAILDDVRGWPAFSVAIEQKRRGPHHTTSIAELESAMDQYGGLSDEEKKLEAADAVRLLLLEIAEQMLMHDMPIIPLYHYSMTELWPAELEGIWMNERDVHLQKFLRWKDGHRPKGSRYSQFPFIWPDRETTR